MQSSLIDSFFTSDPAQQLRRYHIGWLVLLFISGAVLWSIFLNRGSIPFDYHDWAEINAPRVAFAGDAVRKGVLPLHMPDKSALRSLTDRYMSIPDVLLTPQLLLLLWMDVGTFMLVNLLLLYSVGFAGLVWLKQKYRLSGFLFTILFLLFNFNGHIVAHLSVGHYTWVGYFLLPWFFILLIKLEETPPARYWRWLSLMAGLLFFLFLQGSFHQYLWCLLFMGFYVLANWRKALPVIGGAFFSGLLLLVRFLPVTLLFGQFDIEFRGGYPRPWHIFSALMIERLPAELKEPINFNSNLGFWEFDLYVGIAGFFFLLLAAAAWLVPQFKGRRFSPWLSPILFLAFFSIYKFYLPLYNLPIPILNSERVTSRFIIMPLLALLFIALPAVQERLNRWVKNWRYKTILLILAAWLGYDLLRHTLAWQVTEAAKAFPFTAVDLSIKTVANHPDPAYTNLILIGGIASLLTALFLIILSMLEKRRERKIRSNA